MGKFKRKVSRRFGWSGKNQVRFVRPKKADRKTRKSRSIPN